MAIFRSHDFAAGFVLVRGEQFIEAIIRADHVEQVGQPVVIVVADVGPKKGLRDGPGGIVRVKNGDEAGQDGFRFFGLRGVVNLIARAPQHDAGMIPVAPDHVAGVDLGPGVEIQMIVEGVLPDRPAVESLIHDEESHPVAEVEELRSRRVMGGADRIDPNLPERGKPALPGAEGTATPRALASSCRQTPLSLRFSPLSQKPVSAAKRASPIPKVVASSSSVAPPETAAVRIR